MISVVIAGCSARPKHHPFALLLVSYLAVCVPALASPTADTAKTKTEPVRYTISLARAPEHIVRVEIELPRGAAERNFQLPVWNALYQVRDFSQYVGSVQAKNNSGASLKVQPADKSKWRVSGLNGGGEIVYEVYADSGGPFGAQLNGQHGFFNLAEVLMYAEDQRHAPVRVVFIDVPAGWHIATALGRASGGQFFAEDYDRLVDAPVELGTFCEADFDEGGGHYRVVVDGDPADYNLQQIVLTDRRIAAAETAWMNDRPFQDYLFIYHVVRGPARGGMEHADSTAIDVEASRLGEDADSLSDITAHEFFHLWNVKRIRPQSLDPVDYTRENYSDALWFSEGVTSTVSDYARLQAGLLDEPRFLRNVSQQITELELRPAHLIQSVEDSSLDAWLEKYDFYRTPERSISYYNKGYLLGILLDLQMREASHGSASLRELFRWLNEKYARRGHTFADSEGIRLAAEGLCHTDLRPFFDKYVAGTDQILWDDFFRGVGLRVVRRTIRVADPGFAAVRNFDQLPSVTSVDPKSEAERAGLSAGDALLAINGRSWSTDFEQAVSALHPGDRLHLRVRNGGGDRDLSWTLAGRDRVTFELKDVEMLTVAQRAWRAAWLGSEPDNREPRNEARP